MPRYKLTIEYDGAPFVGWQIQGPGLGRSVQGVLTDALLRLTGERRPVSGAGRTDAGVHATGQVAHVDLDRPWRTDTLRDGMSALLRPDPVAVLHAEEVPADFDARFSAVQRHYVYRIVNRRPDLALLRGKAWRVPRPLDTDAMHEAARRLLGKHDFTTFRASECQAKTPVRTLDALTVTRRGETVDIAASARSFLHNQVRSMVGSLVMIGDGRWSADDLEAALEAKDRARCGPVAPSDGLYLAKIDY